MDRSEIGQFFKDTFKKEDSITPVKSGEISKHSRMEDRETRKEVLLRH